MKVLKNLLIFISILIFLFIAYNLCGMFFETKAYNYLQKYFSASTSGTKNIAIIIIDDKSLEKIRWPWKRTEYGKIFEYFKTYGNEKVIIFDSLVMGRDKDNLASDMQFFNQVKTIDNLIVGFSPNFKDYANKIEGENFDKEFKNKFYVNIEDRRTQRSKSMFKSLSQYPRERLLSDKNEWFCIYYKRF
jgi:hypothetical protein